MDSNNSNKSGALPAWKWTGAEALELVHELNERCLAVIGQWSVRNAALGGNGSAISELPGNLWRGFDEAARRRAARCPFLLVEMHFNDLPWWENAKRDGMHASTSALPLSVKTAGLGRALASDALMLAWLTARSDQRTATLLLGLHPRVAAIVSSLNSGEVRRIASRFGQQLRPRWEDRPEIWQGLLEAARSEDEEALTAVHLYGIQLLGRDLLASAAAG
jgi:hypothetical protein